MFMISQSKTEPKINVLTAQKEFPVKCPSGRSKKRPCEKTRCPAMCAITVSYRLSPLGFQSPGKDHPQ